MTANNRRVLAAIVVVVVGVLACSETRAVPDAGMPAVSSVSSSVSYTAPTAPSASVEVDAGDIDALSSRGIDKIEQVATLIAANKGDCVVLGQRLEAYYEENAAFVVEAKQAYSALQTQARKALQKRLRQRFDAAWTKLQPTIKKCKDEPNVAHVLDQVF